MARKSGTEVRWLVKSEPDTYSYEDLVREGRTVWNGVRNAEARKNLRSMKNADLVFFYHSGKTPAIVAIAQVTREAYPEPMAEDWSVVELAPLRQLARAITLAELKQLPDLASFVLVRRGRLSVLPVTSAESSRVLCLEQAKPTAS